MTVSAFVALLISTKIAHAWVFAGLGNFLLLTIHNYKNDSNLLGMIEMLIACVLCGIPGCFMSIAGFLSQPVINFIYGEKK